MKHKGIIVRTKDMTLSALVKTFDNPNVTKRNFKNWKNYDRQATSFYIFVTKL